MYSCFNSLDWLNKFNSDEIVYIVYNMFNFLSQRLKIENQQKDECLHLIFFFSVKQFHKVKQEEEKKRKEI